jgi:hypothetical protein
MEVVCYMHSIAYLQSFMKDADYKLYLQQSVKTFFLYKFGEHRIETWAYKQSSLSSKETVASLTSLESGYGNKGQSESAFR